MTERGLVTLLKRLLKEADEHNARCGKPDRFCNYCRTAVYDGVEGVVHDRNCVIRAAREALRGGDRT